MKLLPLPVLVLMLLPFMLKRVLSLAAPSRSFLR